MQTPPDVMTPSDLALFQSEFLQRAFSDATPSTNSDPYAAGLKIYKQNVIGNAINALASTYAATQAIVGEDFFRAMARKFVQSTPPDSGCYDQYGEHFPQHIANYAPAASLPYLCDVAAYEWCWHQCDTAYDTTPLAAAHLAETLQTSTQSQHIISLVDDAQILACEYAAANIVAYAREPESVSAPPSIDSTPSYYLLKRVNNIVHAQEISKSYYALLWQISQHGQLETAISELLGDDPSLNVEEICISLLNENIISSIA